MYNYIFLIETTSRIGNWNKDFTRKVEDWYSFAVTMLVMHGAWLLMRMSTSYSFSFFFFNEVTPRRMRIWIVARYKWQVTFVGYGFIFFNRVTPFIWI